jgi:hypothetical protein
VQLTADDTIAIYIYIIVKARITDLTSQMQLIDTFVDKYTIEQTKDGFIFASMMQAADYLKEMDENKLQNEEFYLKNLLIKKRHDLDMKKQ